MKSTTLLLALWMAACSLFAQQPTVKWTATIEPRKVFIENKGQFDNCLPAEGQSGFHSPDKVLFATEHGAVQILFSKKGVTYLLQKREYRKTEKQRKYDLNKPYKEWEQEEYSAKVETDAVSIEWENADAGVQLEGVEQAGHYYNYSAGKRQISGARAFEKIVYRNLYPGIDAEFVFHPQEGIEYNFIVRAGADATKIKIKYAGIERMESDAEGNLLLPTLFGNMVDHAPVTYYAGNPASKIASRFVKNGNSVGIALGKYDKTKEVVIDPWTVTPALPNSNKVFCVKTDSSGNVYVYGGDSPFKLQKYNAAGALQWTYSTPWDSSNAWFGTLIVDKAGNSYITRGSLAAISKINTAGTMVWTKEISTASSGDEYWGLALNADETQLIVGGTLDYGGLKISGVLYDIDLNTGTPIDTVKVTYAGIVYPYPNEVRAICYSPNGNYYFLTTDTIGGATPAFGITFRTKHGRAFAYKGPDFGFTPQGQNIICANAYYIYNSTGDSIVKRDINTGSILMGDKISGGGVGTVGIGIAPKNGGIAIDNCGNVYVGSQTAVYKYDGNLNVIDSAATPGAVYALAVSKNGEVAASGAGFVAVINMSACGQYLSPPFNLTVNNTNTTCAGMCNGSATAVTANGTAPFSYIWSNGATSATISGLCPGSYYVTVTDAGGSSMVAGTNILLSPFALTDSVLHTTCGGNTGAVGIVSLTGVAPYTFLWSNGAVTSSIIGVSPGLYSVTVTDAIGCVLTKNFTVLGSGNSPVTITSSHITICEYDSALLCAPAGYLAYQWSNGASTACFVTNVDNVYSVTVTDANYCTASSNSIPLWVVAGPPVSITVSGNVLTATTVGQAVAYQWYRNNSLINFATGSTYTAQLQGYYTVAVTGTNGCVRVSSPVYFSPCTAHFVLFPDLNTPHNWFAVNQATGAAPISYLWSWGDGATSAGAFPTHTYDTAGYYNICLSITDANGCSATYCDSSVYLYKTENAVTVNVVSQLPGNIKEADDAGEMFLFPNPAGDVLNIRYRGLQAERVRLFNINGQLLKEIAQPADNRIAVHELPAGVYVAELKIESSTVRLKWSKK
ncbi:MAG: T9SS type A sorting domain-containing protein [Chitinophagales bacterium]|nr:T9SS type A sorting domain-containing protein [Chitinophagales bacterium]